MILLHEEYFGFPANTITVLARNTELALIAKGLAVKVDPSLNTCTPGDLVNVKVSSGQAAIPTGKTSITIGTPYCHSQSQANVWINGPVNDDTMICVRPQCLDNELIIIGNAACTNNVNVSWAIINDNYTNS